MPKPAPLNRRQLIACGLATASAGIGIGISNAAIHPDTAPTRLQATAGKRFRVLMLTYRGTTDVDIGFQNHLKAAGLNVEFSVRDVQQDASRIAAILDELPTLAPDLIYTWGTPVTLAVTGTVEQPNPHPALRNIPVVFALVADPQKAGIVNTLNAPERNVTGAIHVVPLERQLQHLRSYREFDKLGVIYNPAEANSQAVLQGLQQYGQAHHKQILASPLQQSVDGKPTADGLESLIDQLHSDGAQWLYLPPDTYLGTLYHRITPLAMARKLPLFASTELAMRSGNALTGVVSRYYSVGQLAASKAADILQGHKTVQQTPVESLKRFSLMVRRSSLSCIHRCHCSTTLKSWLFKRRKAPHEHAMSHVMNETTITQVMLRPSQLLQRELIAADLESVLDLHLRCTQNGCETLVRKESLTSLQNLLLRSHMTGLFDQDELVAYSVLQHDLEAHQKLAPSIATDPQRPQLMLNGVSVAPQWQGLGLQRRLIMQRMRLAGPDALLFSTAAPANWHSWNNLLACGFHARGIGFQYGGNHGGHLRYLMVLETLPEHALYPDLSKELHALDIKRQQDILSQGWRGAQPGHNIEYMRYVPPVAQRKRA